MKIHVVCRLLCLVILVERSGAPDNYEEIGMCQNEYTQICMVRGGATMEFFEGDAGIKNFALALPIAVVQDLPPKNISSVRHDDQPIFEGMNKTKYLSADEAYRQRWQTELWYSALISSNTFVLLNVRINVRNLQEEDEFAAHLAIKLGTKELRSQHLTWFKVYKKNTSQVPTIQTLTNATQASPGVSEQEPDLNCNTTGSTDHSITCNCPDHTGIIVSIWATFALIIVCIKWDSFCRGVKCAWAGVRHLWQHMRDPQQQGSTSRNDVESGNNPQITLERMYGEMQSNSSLLRRILTNISTLETLATQNNTILETEFRDLKRKVEDISFRMEQHSTLDRSGQLSTGREIPEEGSGAEESQHQDSPDCEQSPIAFGHESLSADATTGERRRLLSVNLSDNDTE